MITLDTKDINSINEDINLSYKESFGENTDTSAHTVLGNLKAPIAIVMGYVHELLDFVATNINPRTSIGIWLDIICSINNIYRKKNSKSQGIVTFYGEDDTIIPLGTKVSTIDNIEYLTKEEALLVNDSIKIAVESVEFGIASVLANSITKLNSDIPGITSITNEAYTQAGELRETDAQLRKRREDSIAINSKSSSEAIVSNLLALGGVKNAFAYESGDGKTIPITDLPSCYIYVVVDGGATKDIAKVLAKTKTTGVTTLGNTSDTYEDLQGKIVTYYFDRPTRIPISINIEIIITNTRTYPLNGVSQIKTNLYNYLVDSLDIGDNIYQMRAMSAINAVDGCVVSSFEIKKGDDDFTSSSISMSVNEIGSYDINNIEVVIL